MLHQRNVCRPFAAAQCQEDANPSVRWLVYSQKPSRGVELMNSFSFVLAGDFWINSSHISCKVISEAHNHMSFTSQLNFFMMHAGKSITFRNSTLGHFISTINDFISKLKHIIFSHFWTNSTFYNVECRWHYLLLLIERECSMFVWFFLSELLIWPRTKTLSALRQTGGLLK